MSNALLVCIVTQSILAFIGLVSSLLLIAVDKTDAGGVCLAFAAGLLLSVTIVAYLP